MEIIYNGKKSATVRIRRDEAQAAHRILEERGYFVGAARDVYETLCVLCDRKSVIGGQNG